MPEIFSNDTCAANGGLDSAAEALLSLASACPAETTRPALGVGTVLGIPIPLAGPCLRSGEEESPTSLQAGLRQPEATLGPLCSRSSVGGRAKPAPGRGELAPDVPLSLQTFALPFFFPGSQPRPWGIPISPGRPREVLPALRRPSVAEMEAADRRRARDLKRFRPSPQQPRPSGDPQTAAAQARETVHASHQLPPESAHETGRLRSQIGTAWAACAALCAQNQLLNQRVQAQQNDLDGHAQVVRRQNEEHQRRLQRQQETFQEQAKASDLLHEELRLHAEHLQVKLDESHAEAASLGGQRQKEAAEAQAAANRVSRIVSEAQATEASQKRLAKKRKKEISRLRRDLVELEKKGGDERARLEQQIALEREAFALASSQFHRSAMQEAEDSHRRVMMEILRPPASDSKQRSAHARRN